MGYFRDHQGNIDWSKVGAVWLASVGIVVITYSVILIMILITTAAVHSGFGTR